MFLNIILASSEPPPQTRLHGYGTIKPQYDVTDAYLTLCRFQSWDTLTKNPEIISSCSHVTEKQKLKTLKLLQSSSEPSVYLQAISSQLSSDWLPLNLVGGASVL